jgi:hypothetical protein
MKQHQLHELLGSVVARHPSVRLILAGSQALFGHLTSVPPVVEQSIEADLLLAGEAFKARQQIEEEFGMESPYQGATGLYVHPVGLGTITVPRGWEQRLVPFGQDRGWSDVWVLEVHDLTASKLMAGREKDYVFVIELLRNGHVGLDVLLQRFVSFRSGVFANAVDGRLEKLAKQLDATRLRAMADAVRQHLPTQ